MSNQTDRQQVRYFAKTALLHQFLVKSFWISYINIITI